MEYSSSVFRKKVFLQRTPKILRPSAGSWRLSVWRRIPLQVGWPATAKHRRPKHCSYDSAERSTFADWQTADADASTLAYSCSLGAPELFREDVDSLNYTWSVTLSQWSSNPKHSASWLQLSGTLYSSVTKSSAIPSPLSRHIWNLNCSPLRTTRSNISSAAGASDATVTLRHTAPPINVWYWDWHCHVHVVATTNRHIPAGPYTVCPWNRLHCASLERERFWQWRIV